MGKAFWYLGVTATIPIMAFAGYIIGKNYEQELMGALIGTLLGTFLVWIDMLRLSGLIKAKKKKNAGK
jgi:prepilin signal peptidase PulO-like enzyme (type II secretory pathway)